MTERLGKFPNLRTEICSWVVLNSQPSLTSLPQLLGQTSWFWVGPLRSLLIQTPGSELMSDVQQSTHLGLPSTPQRRDGGKAPSAAAPEPRLLLWPWSLSSRMHTGPLSPAIHLRFWTLSKDWDKLARCLCFPWSNAQMVMVHRAWGGTRSHLCFYLRAVYFSLPQSYPLYSAGEYVDI